MNALNRKLLRVTAQAMLAWILTVVPASAALTNTEEPRWTVDLNRYGFALENQEWPRTPEVLFLDEDTIAVTFYSRNPKPGLSRRDQLSDDDPWQVHLLLFDSAGGLKKTWQSGTRPSGTRAFALAGGGILLQSGPFLRAYTRDLVLSAEHVLDDNNRSWHVAVPPEGDLVFARRLKIDDQQLRVFNARTLKLVAEPEISGIPFGFWATKSGLVACHMAWNEFSGIKAGRFGGGWAIVLQEPGVLCGNMQAVGDSHYAVSTMSGAVLGELWGRGRVRLNRPRGWRLVAFASSRHARVVAVVYGNAVNDWFDLGLRRERFLIQVHEVQSGAILAERKMRSKHGMRAALAPNGRSLAILAGSTLMLFEIE